MKNKKNSEAGILPGASSYSMPIEIYIAVCILGLIVIIVLFNNLIAQHDKQLTKEICSLVAEKVTSSIEYMTKSTEDISVIMSCGGEDEIERTYEKLRVSKDNADYLSIGIIMRDGTIYGPESDKTDLAKWGLTETALEAEGVAISKPYRSGLTGQLVFTMFSGIDKGDTRLGSLYITYPFDEILKITYTDSLGSNTEVWLMDAYSDNIIRCSGTEDYLIGSWSNMKVLREITSLPEYASWAGLMRSGAQTGTVTCKDGSSTYTLAFENIGSMDGWNIVVRIPNSQLSSTMQIFRIAIVIFALVVIAATIIFLDITRKHTEKEKKILEHLSIYDPLSQVLNRRAFNLSAEQYLKKADNPRGALMFLDIDLFKRINDSYGHETGDRIIVSTADSLKAVFGECGIVSRYGGDEFVVLVKDKSRAEVTEMVQKLRKLALEVKVDSDPDFELHFSIGLAEFPADGTDFTELLKCADAALYTVKESGRNNFAWQSAG